MGRAFSLKDRLRRFGHAFRGLGLVVSREHNMRIHVLAAVVAVVLGFLMKLTITEWSIIILCMGIVLTAELINSAVERVCDAAFTKKEDPVVKDIKDISAGAVLISAVMALVVGLLIFVPKLLNLVA